MRRTAYVSALLSLAFALGAVSHEAFARDHGPRIANASSSPN